MYTAVRLSRLAKRTLHRFYCYSRSEASYLSGNFETAKDCKDLTKHPSKLFLSGREASQVFAVFCPELDLDYIIDNEKQINEDIKRRNVRINLSTLIENLKVIKKLKKQINTINEARERVAVCATNVSENDVEMNRMKTLRNEGRELKERLKALNRILWNYENATLSELAKLPNLTNPNTPLQNEVLTEHDSKGRISFCAKSHTELGKLSQSVKFSNTSPYGYYLCNLAAILELAISNYFADMMRNAGFLNVINPDFCKSVILEGCGKTLEEISQYMTLKAHQVDGHSFHLTGCASLEGYASSLSRIIVNNTSLPLLYFSIGRCYNTTKGTEQNLFSAIQAVKVTAFVASVESESMNHFSSLLDIIETSYKNINLPFRSTKVGAHLLKSAESLRVEFDLWSPHKKEYVNAGHVSLCTDYISRRLMMKHGTERKAEAFLHITEATITCIPVMIGCIMENMQTVEGKFLVPDIFKPYINILKP